MIATSLLRNKKTFKAFYISVEKPLSPNMQKWHLGKSRCTVRGLEGMDRP
jgi:hypothetical protein